VLVESTLVRDGSEENYSEKRMAARSEEFWRVKDLGIEELLEEKGSLERKAPRREQLPRRLTSLRAD
jgi:hypothetical protein